MHSVKLGYLVCAVTVHHLRKPRVLSSFRSLRVRNEVNLVPLTFEDDCTSTFNFV